MIRAIELYPCAGGMAEGFRRAGITFDIAFDFSADACASYEANLGHRPICIDVRDVVRMARLGARFGRIDLLVADPPCTPWSRAGKRKGLDDEHDMLRETCELIGLLKPTCWLIGNVPGLDDSTNGDAVAATIGALSRRGYDVDYAKLNASSYGVPQHRVRPFWFGRPRGSEPLRWPTPTHGAPGNLALPGCELLPWVTCRDALQHLPLEELGRPVRVKWKRDTDHKTASPDEPAPTATKNTHGDGALLSVRVADTDGHPQPTPDSPSPTIRGGGRGHAAPDSILLVTSEERPRTRKRAFHNPHPPSEADAPARGLTTSPRAGHGGGAGVLLAHSNRGGHPLSEADAPAGTIVARADQRGARGGGVMLAASVDGGRNNHPPSTPNEPARTVTGSDGGGIKGHTLTWPWDVPATTVTQDDRLAPPGHHPESGSVLSVPNAVVLSEKARAILQGFPENWKFLGDTKRSRSAMIGMAMPPPHGARRGDEHRALVRSVRSTRAARGGGRVSQAVLPWASGAWFKVKRTDARARSLADRHYSRQTPGAADFMASGRTFVLLTHDGTAVWGVIENLDPAGALRWRCSIFRNEGATRSSDLIREATERTYSHWRAEYGALPEVPLTTEVDPAKTRRKRDPGRCFRRAGWRQIAIRRGLVILEAPPEVFS